MPTLYTVSGDLDAMLGGPVPSPQVFIETNLAAGEALIDQTGETVRLGRKTRVSTVGGSSTFTTPELWGSDSTDLNVEPGTLKYQISVTYPGASNGSRETWRSGWFFLNADVDVSDPALATSVTPTVVQTAGALIAEMEGIRDQTAAISGLTGEDAAVALLVGDDTTPSATRAAFRDALTEELDDEASDAAKRLPAMSLKSFGAALDGVTDDTAAVQAAVNWLKAYTVTDPPLARPRSITGHGGVAKITGGIDATGLDLGRGWAIRDLTIWAACAGEVALDLTGSRFGRLPGVRVWGDFTAQPHTGVLLSSGSDQMTDPCSNFVLEASTVDGYFTSSALHLNAAEENSFRSCMFVNRRTPDAGGESWAVILDGAGFKTLPVGPMARSATRGSFTVNRFDKCAIQKPFGIAGPTMFLQDVASLSFESCYLTAGSDSAIVWRLTDGFTPYRVYMDFQCETTGLDRFIEFTSDGVTGVHEIRGLECTFGNMFTDSEVYSVDGSVVSLALRAFKSRIYRWAAGVALAGDLFGSPGKVSVYGGDIVVPAASDLNVPAAFARFDASVLTMDGSAVNWTYVPVLSNWTLGNGVITGEYRKVGRQVHYEIRYVVGSTDTPAGNFVVSLPMPADGGSAGKPRGQAHLFDSSANIHKMRWATHATSSTLNLVDVDYGLVGALNPFTFAAGDVIDISGTYEAAS